MMTPVAVLLDFFAGWTPPRHLYRPELYRVWGNLPYSSADHWTHTVFDLLYPGERERECVCVCAMENLVSMHLGTYTLHVCAHEHAGGGIRWQV